jgi:tetratricopeptide (TPR) repeat protein
MHKYLKNNRWTTSLNEWGKFLFPLFFYCLCCPGSALDVERFKAYYAEASCFNIALPSYAESNLAVEKKNQEKVFGWSYAAALHIIGSENPLDLEKWEYLKSVSLDLMPEEDSSPWQLFARSEINLIWGFARMRAGKRISGANDVRQAWNLTEKILEKWPQFTPALKNRALLQALVGLVPSSYRRVAGILGFSGSLEDGLKNLERIYPLTTAGQFRFLNEQVGFLWLIILKNYGSESELSDALSKFFLPSERKGPLIRYAVASALIGQGKRKQAQGLLFGSDEAATISFPWLLWLKANFLLQDLNPEAEKYFIKFIKQNGAASYKKASYLRLSWLNQCLGNSQKTAYFRKKVLTEGKADVDEDAEALREVENNVIQETCLLRARLRFDGGDFFAALNEVNRCSPAGFRSLRYLEEYYYRLGRIYYKLGEETKAIQMFVKCLATPGQSDGYFKPNSALLMGLIMEQKGRREDSKKFYESAIAFRNHEYERSIEQKARAGLARISVY